MPFPLTLEHHDMVVADLADLLTELQPDAPAWTWMEGAGESTVGGWARRMAHEALVHRADAELTAGINVSVTDEALAVDGMNEVLTWMAGDPDLIAAEGVLGNASGTVLLDYGAGAWLVDIGDRRHLVTPTATGTSADAIVSGDPMALDLLLWGRPSSATWPAGHLVDRLRDRIAQSTQ
jgi:hypothetical protein